MYELGDISDFPHTKKIKNSMNIFPKSRNDKSETELAAGNYPLGKKGTTNSWLGWGSIQNKGGADLLKMKREISNEKAFLNYILQGCGAGWSIFSFLANISRTAVNLYRRVTVIARVCSLNLNDNEQTKNQVKIGLSAERLSLTYNRG